MKDILERYEKLSGQSINFTKSVVTFSPNTNRQCRQQICTTLQVQESDLPGNYLGLPMFIGRRKNNAFKFLTERVSQKLQNWSNKKLSKGGKLVLLKTAAQSVPNFWMSLFLIPNEICNEIERHMNSFWWGSGGSGKGIRWMAWERLCDGKYNGGLGFRDLKKFNVAMLAKQGWRLINGDNSLVTRLMKAKYYPNNEFIDATLGSNPSYVWRSILQPQHVIKQGCRRRIGDGEDTNIWKVPWLPCLQNGYLTTNSS
ncbi:putative mitochondrial protein AtMg00310 [Apium graveolens]|uniref:putative mitochondrial protein AtMg00310 n=1 Tax=Apium graveolens TaxID=4045 RepID=UPI003D78FD48